MKIPTSIREALAMLQMESKNHRWSPSNKFGKMKFYICKRCGVRAITMDNDHQIFRISDYVYSRFNLTNQEILSTMTETCEEEYVMKVMES